MSSTGSVESHRIRLNLTVQVDHVNFSSASAPAPDGTTTPSGSTAPPPTASLGISGRVTSANDHVRLGAFHTLDIESNRDVMIEKVDGWDSISLSRVEESCIPGRGAEVGAVVCGEGSAALCLLSQHMTVITHRLSITIPRKGSASGASQHEKALTKFYGTLFDAFLRHIPFSNLKAIVLASPGWVRDAVYEYMVAEASRRGDKTLGRALKEKVIKVHISSPHVHSLMEVMKSPEVSLACRFLPNYLTIFRRHIDHITAQRNKICKRGDYA